MNEKEKTKLILKILNKIYPTTITPLKHTNNFTLLISVLLSAQCTDLNVNNVTKNIYPKYNKPEHFIKLGRKKIEKLIKSIGLFRVKSKNIFFLSKQLIEKHNGKVPKTFGELEANVVGKSANITPTERGLDPVNMQKVIATNQKVPEDFVGSYDATAGRAVSGKQPGFQRRKRSN